MDDDVELPAWQYPWAPAAASGVLTREGFRRVDTGPGAAVLDEVLDELRAAPMMARTAVVAVGANASPEVVRRKLARHGMPDGPSRLAVPFRRGTVHGVGIGHSAHVSLRGYVAAAPFAADRPTPVVVSWLDPPQLEAVDATEPNYRRRRLDRSRTSLVLDDGSPVEAADVYVSVHGVLTGSGGPVALMPQRDLHDWLRHRLPDLGPVLAGEAPQVADRLTDPEVREQVRLLLRQAGLVADDELPTA